MYERHGVYDLGCQSVVRLDAVAAQDSARAQIDVEAMALHMELAKPGPEHERLAELEGVWHQHVKAWMEPGAEPMEFSCVSTTG